MPELPEVETFARYFRRHALGQRIERVHVRDERILADIRKETFARKLKGHTFASVRRHGKHLFADAGGLWLHLHFGMTGDLAYYRDIEDEPRFAKVVFDFEGGNHLAFEDVRLFGLAELIDSPDAFIEERGLGPDPLEKPFTRARFEKLLATRRGAIKSLLMSQDLIAGLGNLYVDEPSTNATSTLAAPSTASTTASAAPSTPPSAASSATPSPATNATPTTLRDSSSTTAKKAPAAPAAAAPSNKPWSSAERRSSAPNTNGSRGDRFNS
jgi:formamidopyrimidine-DNA glycosylase